MANNPKPPAADASVAGPDQGATEAHADGSTMRLFHIVYDAENLVESQDAKPEQCLPTANPEQVTWCHVAGLANSSRLFELHAHYELHPLVQEDILNTDQRAKLEDWDDYVYVVLRSLRLNAQQEIVEEQVSLILGDNYVLSFEQGPADYYEPLAERLRNDHGHIQHMGADYLAYSLIDTVVDKYLTVVEHLGEEIEAIGNDLVSHPDHRGLQRIQDIKAQVLHVRRAIWPLREVAAALARGDSELVHGDTRRYFRDVHDHTIQIIETVEIAREMASSLLDTYLSSASNNMNQVMKVLTIISTTLMPLTFIAGVYGMNFRHMPELEWRWGYPFALLLMLVVAALMLSFFRRRRWW